MDEEKKPEDSKNEIKISSKPLKLKIPRITSGKLAAVFGGLITAVIIIAVIMTFFNIGGKISGQAAGESAAEYLTGNFLEAQGMSAEAAGVTDKGSYYLVNVDIKEGASKVDTASVFVSKDGKDLFVGQIYDLTSEPSTITGSTTQAPTNTPTPEVTKSDKPNVELFIMSYCPYGLQMQKGLLPVMKLLGDKIDVEIKWVHYVMHGEKEATENTRQYCIQKEQNDKYFDYINCFVVDGEVDSCLSKAAIDTTKLTSCMDKTTTDFGVQADLDSGEKFPRYKVTAEDSEGYGVRGSPTLVINGEQVQSARDSESIKQAICAAFNTAPTECEEELDATPPSPGLGGGTGDASAGYCG
jgi:protein-disulfide isomerase